MGSYVPSPFYLYLCFALPQIQASNFFSGWQYLILAPQNQSVLSFMSLMMVHLQFKGQN